ncbi:minor capsid protein [Fulvivirga sp. 29W222]|uniref:Minor capsid protein n=1 Tax=Fulvivirga marina TaxID=2494733 RepID=A0A937KDK6_9BACT|nr:phage minor head protein [Fulvivirga marina]MBL6448564.1 minor capsid protein [Fulvivirga marina]
MDATKINYAAWRCCHRAGKAKLTLVGQLKQLYSPRCNHAQERHREIKLTYQDDLTKIIEKLIEKIYNGESVAIDQELYELTAKELFGAVEQGFGMSMEIAEGANLEMLGKLRENVYVFSGFKNYQMLREATDLLIDENGARRSFSQFRDMVLKLNQEYNVNFLRAEYNHATASSRMASKWVQILSQAETLPLLEYITAGDSRVRESHKTMDRVILPVTHPFWDKYMPPNDWGCRCTVRQLAEGDRTKPQDIPEPQLKEMFLSNPGKDGVVFPSTHPYYNIVNPEDADNNFGLNIPNA